MVKIIIPLVLSFLVLGFTPATISQITDIIMWFIYIIIVLALSELLIIKMLLGWLQR